MADAKIDHLEIEIEADSNDAASALDRLTASLQRLQGAAKGNTALQQTAQQVKGVSKVPSLSRLEKELARIEKQATRDGNSLVALQRKLEDLQQYQGIGNRLTQADTASQIKEVEAQIRRLSNSVDTADTRIRELRQTIKSVQSGTIPTVKVQAPTGKTSGAPVDVAQVKQAAAATQNVSGAVRSVKTNLDKATGSARKLGDTLKKTSSTGSGGMAALGRSIKGMVTSFAVFGVVSSITGAIGDSFARMAKENEGVNQTLSSIKSSLQYVTDALASVVYPIVQALAPIVTAILDALAGILNVLARVIAFLTGQDTVVQATKQQVDFAGSLDGTADSMDGVTSAAKKMYRALLPIDELNILEDTSGGGGSIGGLGDLRFEEVAVDPIKLPDTIASPKWSPDPVPAPSFAPVVVPALAGALVPSPEWEPNPIPAPVFEALGVPEWLLTPLPVPEWESNPILVPVLEINPVRVGLAQLQEAFAAAWDYVSAKSSEGAAAFSGILTSTAGNTSIFANDTEAKLAAWALLTQGNFSKVAGYIQTIMPPALSGAATVFSGFIAATTSAVALWGENVDENVRTTLQYIADSCASALSSAGSALAEWVNTTSGNFAAWAQNVIKNAGAAAQGIFNNIVSGLSAAWDQFVGFMKGIGEKISGWWSANKHWAAPVLAGIAIAGVTVAAVTLSGGSALAAAPALVAAIPALASGGVLTDPQVVLAGEYPGARSNPEIVTPQSLMLETFRKAQNNDDVVSAIFAGVQRIVAAIESNSGDTYLDGDKISQHVTAWQNRQNRIYGRPVQKI